MFLEDKLLEIGRNADYQSKDGIYKGVSEMLDACMKSIFSHITPNEVTFKQIEWQFKRANITWERVYDTLQKEGLGLVKRDGFKTYINNHKEYSKYVKL